MNTIRSTWLGWGTLCIAGGGAYYFAKRSINADREKRFVVEQERKSLQRRMEAAELESRTAPQKGTSKNRRKLRDELGREGGGDGDVGITQSKVLDHAGSPSGEISQDAAPVGHAPETDTHRIFERSKYEAAEPYRSRKGDRFS